MGCVHTKDEADDADCIIDDSHMCCGNCLSSGNVCKACLHAVPVCRVKRCNDCGEVHCADCLHNDPIRQLPERVCSKCLVLSSGQFMPQDLTAYSVRELRQFLFRNDVAVDHCVEKADLIELVMLMSCSSEYLSRIDEHTQHLQMLRERVHREQFPEVPSVSANFLNDSSTLGSNDLSAATVDSLGNEANLEITGGKTTSSTCSEQTPEDPSLPLRPESIEDADGTVVTNCHSCIDRIKEMSEDDVPELNDLTSSATESILSTADGVGITCPVVEPQEKVRGAKTNHFQSKEVSGKKVGGHLCRLCSQASIDCVFLECGHMVACYSCGERLVDCPVCRNYVTRCVRAFRA